MSWSARSQCSTRFSSVRISTPGDRQSFEEAKQNQEQLLSLGEKRLQQAEQIANLPTQEEKTLSIAQSNIQLKQAQLGLLRQELELSREIADLPLDRAVAGAKLLKDQYEASLNPLRDMLDLLQRQDTVIQDQINSSRDLLAAMGQTNDTDPVLAALKVQKDQAELEGRKTPELDKQLADREKLNQLYADQNHLQNIGLIQQDAQNKLAQDDPKLKLDQAAVTAAPLDANIRALTSEKTIRGDLNALADVGRDIDEKTLGIESTKLQILLQQIEARRNSLSRRRNRPLLHSSVAVVARIG